MIEEVEEVTEDIQEFRKLTVQASSLTDRTCSLGDVAQIFFECLKRKSETLGLKDSETKDLTQKTLTQFKFTQDKFPPGLRKLLHHPPVSVKDHVQWKEFLENFWCFFYKPKLCSITRPVSQPHVKSQELERKDNLGIVTPKKQKHEFPENRKRHLFDFSSCKGNRKKP
jgi:hypothetical protein